MAIVNKHSALHFRYQSRNIRKLGRNHGRCYPRPIFTKRTGILPQDLTKIRTHEVRIKTFPIRLKFDRHISSSPAEKPVKFQSDAIIITSNLAAPRLREICR